MNRWGGKALLTGLTLAAIALALGTIVLQLEFWQLPLACLITGVIAARLHAKKALLLFLFLLPLINSTPDLFFNGYPFNYMAPALFLLAGMFLVSLAKKDEQFTPPDWLNPYLFFLSILWLSAFFIFLRWSNLTLSPRAFLKDTPVSPAGDRLSFASIFPVITIFLFTLAPWLALLLRRYRVSSREAMRPLLAGFSLSLLLAILQKTLFPDFLAQGWWASIGQFNGGFSDFNGLGFFSGVLFLVTFIYLLNEFFPDTAAAPAGTKGGKSPGWKKILKVFFPVMALVGIMISGSRSALFFVLVGLMAFLLNKKIRPRYRILIIGVIILAILIPGGTLVRRLEKMGEQVNQLFSGSNVLDALNTITNGRVVMLQQWSIALKKFPLSGVGAGNFLFYFRFQNFGRREYEDLPLNQYLHIAVETGFIGLLAFVFFLASLWRSQRRKADRLVLAAILMILFVNTAFWLPECILLFFFLTAGEGGDPPSRSHRFWRPLPVMTVLLVFVLANIAAFSALHPVNWAKQCRTEYDYGFSPVERDSGGIFRWSGADSGFYLNQGEANAVEVRCEAPLDRIPGKSQAVHIYWNGSRIASKLFIRNDHLGIPVNGRAGFLEFRVSPLFSPKSLHLSADPRKLGVQVLFPQPRLP